MHAKGLSHFDRRALFVYTEPMTNIIETIAAGHGVRPQQVQTALDLLNEGATIPFIARYRKEQTGNLDEDVLQAIAQEWKYQNNLLERKQSILGLLEEKKLLNDSIKKAVLEVPTLAALEEVYRPYKEKRKTKASEAMAAGYGPLADQIWKQKADPKTLGDEEALVQAGYILAERIAEDPAMRQIVRKRMERESCMESTLKKDAQDEKGVFETYYDFSQSVRSIPSHRVLALERGEKEKVLTVTLSADTQAMQEDLARKIIRNPKSRPYLEGVIADALSRLMLPSIKREIRSNLREKAHAKAIENFASNLEHLLMTRPVKGMRVMAWDPGYAHGCKLALLDEHGSLLDTAILFPFRNSSQKEVPANQRSQAEQLILKWKPQLIVIGNGTASRESEALVASIVSDHPELEISYVIGSETGASVYSASDLAREEFPDLPVEKRSAISIGRRVQDPLSELVKIDPQALGIGEYQHDVSQKQLRENLDFVTDKVVNRVGVNVNTASFSLLRHVSGLTKPSINKILKARSVHPFTSRTQLEKLLSAKAYEQSIGFLRIARPENPLDATGIHPESYALTDQLLSLLNLDLSRQNDPAFARVLSKQNAKDLAGKLNAGEYTIADILEELKKPGLDPRDSLDGPILKKGVMQIEDLHPGMELQGTVRNVTSFGAFVDIGLHDDGLVHISKMAKRRINDPSEIVHTGQIVTVYVLETDLRRGRISLSLLPPRT